MLPAPISTVVLRKWRKGRWDVLAKPLWLLTETVIEVTHYCNTWIQPDVSPLVINGVRTREKLRRKGAGGGKNIAPKSLTRNVGSLQIYP